MYYSIHNNTNDEYVDLDNIVINTTTDELENAYVEEPKKIKIHISGEVFNPRGY